MDLWWENGGEVPVAYKQMVTVQNVAFTVTIIFQEGCWGILDEFHRAPAAVVSVIFHYVQSVIDALKVGQTSCYVNEGKEVSYRYNIELRNSYWSFDIQ